MRKDITFHIHLLSQASVAILSYPIPSHPWHTVTTDLLKLPLTLPGSQQLFVAINPFSRYNVLIPICDKSAQAVEREFVDHVIYEFTTPNILLSDSGKECVNDPLTAIC